MKIVKHYEAAAAEPKATSAPVVKLEPTSEKLTELRAKKTADWTLMLAMEAQSPEQQAAMLELFKLDGEIKAEINHLNALAKQAELDELKNKRLELASNYRNAIVANYEANATLSKIAQNKRTPEDIEVANVANDAEKAAFEALSNALLSKFAAPSAIKSPSADGTAVGPKGNVSVEIKAILDEELAAGKSLTDAKKTAIDKGYSRGTVGTVATKFWPTGK